MQMLMKFESRSSRAKVVAFHPSRPWILVGLYSSMIQLWDYRMGTVIDRFEGHEGPVRGIDIHPTQQMFVSCGDDATVRVWSLQTRKLLFTLTGHFDYVRTVFFHPELPWIVSASDDQTIRIWNWQSRQEIACLTGHSHWVSCAKFHPTEDLIISGSMDTMVRVWDISGLRKRHAPGVPPGGLSGAGFGMNGVPGAFPSGDGFPGGPPGYGGNSGPPGGMPPALGSTDDDLFASDVAVKYVLQGHDRSVTWVSIHPTLPLILSASDDRTLKVWRMSESRAWEVDTCRGHSDDVTGCEFHPYQELIVSTGADRTIRTWDLHKRTPVHSFRRENEKLWGVWFHPNQNLVAAAHDAGVIVFKFERERPASALTPDGSLLYVGRDKVLHDQTGKALISFKKFGTPYESMRELSYNPAEKAILTTAFTDTSKKSGYLLAKLPTGALAGPVEPSRALEGSGNHALFVSRNRFCVLSNSDTLELRDMDNALTRSVPLPIETQRLAASPDAGQVYLIGAKYVVLFDIQQRKVLAKTLLSGVRYVAVNPSGTLVALQSKHVIVLANAKTLESTANIRETIRIKSVAWDQDLPVLIYTTFNHLKYALMNGDTGVLKTCAHTIYVTKIRGSEVTALTRKGEAEVLKIDPTEYRFKRALISKQYGEVARLIKTSQLVGQSIVAYLQKRGHPEIALEFVEDAQTRLDLAVECGNLEVAATEARKIGTPAADRILAKAALEQGNHDILEDIYQRQRDFDRLSFLYLVTGHRGRLQKLEDIAAQRGDPAAQFQTSLFLGNVQNRIELLEHAGLRQLAYALAKSHGLNERARELSTGFDTSKITIENVAEDPLVGVTHPTYETVWPVKKIEHTSILDAVANLTVDDAAAESGAAGATGKQVANGDLDDLDDLTAGDDLGDEWDLDVEIEEDDGSGDLKVDPAVTSDISVTESWLRGSTLAADHVAAGSFETAAQLLNRQVGVVNFVPLKERFLSVYKASKLYLAAHDGLPSLPLYVMRAGGELPYIPGMDHLQAMLTEAYGHVRANHIELAVDTFRQVLYTVVLLAVTSESEVEECKRVIETCRNYILAFTIELKRRSLPSDDVKRNLELAAYFTKPKLRSAHAILALRVALTQAFSAKNYVLAGHFAAAYLTLDSKGSAADRVRKIKQKCDQNPLDAIDINFDMFAEFDICPSSLTPIYEGEPTEVDPLTRAPYHAKAKGQLCVITGITRVGAPAAGLRLM